MMAKGQYQKEKQRKADALAQINQSTGLAEIVLAVKGLDSQNRVAITKVHNMQVELSGLKASLDKFIAAIVEVHDEPTKLGEVQAVLRDFLNQSQSQNNRKST